MRKIFIFFILFNFSFLNSELLLNNYNGIEEKEIDPNSLCSGIKFLFDGINLLLFEHNSITGINYLLDSILSFFNDSINNDKTNNLKNEVQELIIKLKYQITVLINSSFKIGECDKKILVNYEQKNKIVNAVKIIFNNLITLHINSNNISNNGIESLSKLLEIVSIIFSSNLTEDTKLNCNNTLFHDIYNTNDILINKIKSVNEETKKNNLKYQKDLIDGILQIFNNAINLALENNGNLEYYKETISGLSKIINSLIADNYKCKRAVKI